MSGTGHLLRRPARARAGKYPGQTDHEREGHRRKGRARANLIRGVREGQAEYERPVRPAGRLVRQGQDSGGQELHVLSDRPGGEQLAGSDNARSYFAFVPRLADHVTLLPGGRMPQEQALSDPGHPLVLEGLIPAKAARLFGLELAIACRRCRTGKTRSPTPTWWSPAYSSEMTATTRSWHLDETILKAVTSGNFRTVPVLHLRVDLYGRSSEAHSAI